MAGSERKLTVVLAGDHRSLDRSLAVSGGKVDTFGSKVSGLSGKAKLAMAGAATAVLAFGKSSITAFVEAEESQTKLQQAFDKFPALAGGNINALRSLNTELMKKTKFDDDATAAGQASLAAFNLTGEQIAKLTPLMQDYAEKTGKDLPTAAQDLGKAILGQGRALKPLGINFKDTGTAAGNLEQLMAGLNDKVGGFAETAGTTAAGKAKILSNQFGELQEKVGSKLVPALVTLADKLLVVGSWLGEHKPVLIALTAVIGVGMVAAMVAWTAGAYNAAVASGAWATAMSAIPVVAIGVAIAALVVIVVKNWDTIKEKTGQMVDWVVDKFGFITEIPGKIGTAFSKVGEFISKPFIWAFDQIAKLWNATIGSLRFEIPSWIPGVGGKGFDVPDLPRVKGLAKGGLVTSGGVFDVGERGKERVFLPAGAAVSPNGAASGGTVVNVNVVVGPTANLSAVGQEIKRALDAYFAGGGSAGWAA